MSKFKKTEEKEEIPKPTFLHAELDKLDRGIEKYGKEGFLQRMKAIRVDEKGNWSIITYPGLALEMIKTGLGQTEYNTDTPYVFWQEAIEQLDIYKSRERFIEKKKLEGLEKLAEEMTITEDEDNDPR